MSTFEYVFILVSLIIGLAIAEVLEGVARLMGSSVKPRQYYWVQLLQLALILLLAVQIWWLGWELHDRASWTLPTVLLFLFGPTVIYLAAHLVLPERLEGVQLDEYYFAVASRVYLLLFLALMWGYAGGVTFLGLPIIAARTLPQLGVGILLGYLGLTRRRWAHGVGIVALLLLLILSTDFRGVVIAE